MDLDNNVEIETINHDLKIEWIELNEFGNELLFMDKKRSLHLYHINNDDGNGNNTLGFGAQRRSNNTTSTFGATSNGNKKQQKRVTLLNFCNYAQWVPESNVVVAQNRNNLCVWYNIHNTSQVTIVDIKGMLIYFICTHDFEGRRSMRYISNSFLILFLVFDVSNIKIFFIVPYPSTI